MGKRDLNALLGVGKKPSGAKKGGAGKRDLSALLGVGKESGGAAKARKASVAGGTGQAEPERAVEAEDPGPRPSRWGAGVADDDGDAPGPAPAPVGPSGRSRWNDDEESSDSEEDAAREAAEREAAAAAEAASAPESYMDRMVREAMEFKVAQETAADGAEDGELPSNGHHRQPLDKAALMTPSTDEDATPREAPEDDAAAPADTPSARGEADADADGRPAALHHPNVTDRRTTAGGGGGTTTTTLHARGPSYGTS